MKEKEYFITKLSDRIDPKYQYYRTLEINKDGNPIEKELNKLKKLEEDREVVFLIKEEEMTIVSFKNIGKLTKTIEKEYVNNFYDNTLKTVEYRTSENTKASVEKLISLLDMKKSLNDNMSLLEKIKLDRKIHGKHK